MTPLYLDPRHPLDIEPAAESNVERITDCCLDVNGKSAYLVKARGGGAWWMIWIAMACLVPALVIPPFYSEPLEVYAASLTFASVACLGFGITLYVWDIRVWRTHIPLRFSRKTRKVYFHWKGKTYIEDWDTLRAYLKVQFGVSGTGAPSNAPQINIEFHEEDGKPLTVFLIGTDKKGLTVDEKAAAFWEYIRRYMEEGPQSVPAPDLSIWKPVAYEDLLKLHSPLPIIKTRRKWLWPVCVFVLFPLRIVWFLISFPTEFLYYHLEKRIKVDPFPPEMEEAGRCE